VNPFNPREFEQERAELQEQLRTAGDLARGSIVAQLAQLDRDEAEQQRESEARQRGKEAEALQAEARLAASKAVYDFDRGTLVSDVQIDPAAIRQHAMRKAETQAHVELIFAELKARPNLHIVHADRLFKAKLRELRAADPTIGAFLDACTLPAFAPPERLAEAERKLFPYQPPAPAPAPWPAPEPRYLAEALEVVELVYSQPGLQLSYRHPLTNEIAGADTGHSTTLSREQVTAAVKRGAALAWRAHGKRSVPPTLEGLGEWRPADDGSGFVYAPSYAVKGAR